MTQVDKRNRRGDLCYWNVEYSGQSRKRRPSVCHAATASQADHKDQVLLVTAIATAKPARKKAHGGQHPKGSHRHGGGEGGGGGEEGA